MDLELRTVIGARSRDGDCAFALSTHRTALVMASGRTVTVHDISNGSVSVVVRTPSDVEHVVYVGSATGGDGCYLLFLADGTLSSYAERAHGVVFAESSPQERRAVFASGSSSGHACFVKEDSTNLWCVNCGADGQLSAVFKLRTDTEGGNDGAMDGMFARVRGIAGKKAAEVAAVASHPQQPLVAAAYADGVIRVWDVRRRVQRPHFDAQLLIGEKIAALQFHPVMLVVVACTSHGRILSFRIVNAAFRRGAEPALAASKARERSRAFVQCAFVGPTPPYLFLLTRTRRVLVRALNPDGVVLRSARYAASTRPLPVTKSLTAREDVLAESRRVQSAMNEPNSRIAIDYDSLFGLLAIKYERSGPVYIYQRRVDRMPFIARPVHVGIDARFSDGAELAKQPIVVHRDALFVQAGVLYRYTLGSEITARLCTLPHGDVRFMRVARDNSGAAIAALVFMYIDEQPEEAPASDRPDSSSFARYVLCTQVGDDNAWNVSEPIDGRAGCFLGAEGAHDQLFAVANTGHAASLLSFSQGRKRTAARGVRRVSLGADRAEIVFRSPFCAWMAVVYFDALKKRVVASHNTFRRCQANAPAEEKLNIAEADNGYAMEADADLKLRPREIVLDVRWQMRSGGQGPRWIGAILTNQSVHLVQDVLSPLARLDFESLEKTAVLSFAPPSMLWMGPSVALLVGSSLYAVTFDGRADFLAGLGGAHNASILLAALPDRAIYAKPGGYAGDAAVASRPYSALSVLIRSALATSWKGNSSPIDEISELLRTKDASQGSEEMINALVRNGLAPIAYLVCVARQGEYIVPPLKRAAVLARIGDIRGALNGVETQYAKLQDPDSFHSGTEMHRITQRIMNMAILCKDLEVAKRCAKLLGRKGAFEAFVECEGGYSALMVIVEEMKKIRNPQLLHAMSKIVEKSSNSCVAAEQSQLPSATEMKNTRRAIESMDVSNVMLGTADNVRIAILSDSSQGVEMVEPVVPQSAVERLEMFADREVVRLKEGDESDSVKVAAPVLDASVIEGAAALDDARAIEPAQVPALAPVPPIVEAEARKKKNIDEYSEMAEQKLQAGMGSVDLGRYEDALKDFDGGIKAMGKHVKNLGVSSKNVTDAMATKNRVTLGVLVGYRMAMKLWLAQEEVRTSAHATSMAGRVTLAQLATAMAFAHGFYTRHAIGALNLAADANMTVGNWGTAARCLVQIRALAGRDQVSDAVKLALRNKYARCQAMGLQDGQNTFSSTLCYESLRAIHPNDKWLYCNLCPAKFSLAAGLCVGQKCPCCVIGLIVV